MNETTKEIGLFGVMHASSIQTCSIPYYSQIKTFHLFHTKAISIQIIDGIGVIDPFTDKIPQYESDETDYEELFEFIDGNVTEIKDLELIVQTKEIGKHLNNLIQYLYGSPVIHIEIGFGLKDKKIYLTEVISCQIKYQEIYNHLQIIPNGLETFISYFALCISFTWPSDKCYSFDNCPNKPVIPATLSAVISYDLTNLFIYDNMDFFADIIKSSLRDLDPLLLRKTVCFCPSCYKKWQLTEAKKIKMSKMPVVANHQRKKGKRGLQNRKSMLANTGQILLKEKNKKSLIPKNRLSLSIDFL